MIIDDLLKKTAETTQFKYEDLKFIYDERKSLEIVFRMINLSQRTGFDILDIHYRLKNIQFNSSFKQVLH